ncbi:hypothetical protein CPPEL_08290 [Corynebacterium pseudopelargi]|uniref:Phage integrase family protein n=1 Tax=Corynebacterium pseudopelargi TaxID=2080757 RepID=A0A3G6IVR0_9CORY|nr:hypothetical protein CPPEL_08290 [Corynebacterium pseudopelargi]
MALAKASKHPDVVWVLGTTGMRIGELTGLQARDIDVVGRRISIERNAVLVDSLSVVGTPKNGGAPCGHRARVCVRDAGGAVSAEVAVRVGVF